MAPERIAIVGAGPAGFATARAYREHGGDAEVTLIGEEPVAPYRRPPLTKEFLRGELDDAELALERPSWFQANAVTLRLGVRATAIDPADGTVLLAGGERVAADATVIATGSEPLRSELPGIEHPAVMTMRTLADSVALRERARASGRVVVIGTGFIGCEIAGSLAMRGEAVTLVGQEALPQLARLGEDAARHVAGWLRQLGVDLVCGTAVRAIHDGRIVELEDRSHLPGDCIVLGMGARPRGQVARTAGLAINGASVLVDESMRATHAVGEVLAVGDVACAFNTSAGRHLTVEHWGDALEQGALAGQALAGRDCAWASVPGFWSTIGARTLKYAAWGDGYDESRIDAHPDGAFTVWYSRGGAAVGVLTHERDEDYERGRELVRAGAAIP